MNPWIWLSGFGCVLFAFLWRFGMPKYRPVVAPWAIGSGLLCAGLLIGPPADKIAGAAAAVVVALWLLRNFLR